MSQLQKRIKLTVPRLLLKGILEKIRIAVLVMRMMLITSLSLKLKIGLQRGKLRDRFSKLWMESSWPGRQWRKWWWQM